MLLAGDSGSDAEVYSINGMRQVLQSARHFSKKKRKEKQSGVPYLPGKIIANISLHLDIYINMKRRSDISKLQFEQTKRDPHLKTKQKQKKKICTSTYNFLHLSRHLKNGRKKKVGKTEIK